MLELIVLGQVPGTQIIITFSWAVAILTVVSGIYMLYFIRRQRAIGMLVNLEETTL